MGIDAFGSPIGAAAMNPPFKMTAGFIPKNAGFQRTRSASLPVSTEPTSPSIPVSDSGIDGVLRYVSPSSEIV